ncbi:hypothetical protein AND4_00553 [Vibrio sp. AND4]|nr:hypothetical protein AND4_00553 [Vibrio sp. AND4]
MGSKSIISICIAKLPLYNGFEVVLVYEQATSIIRVSISAFRLLFHLVHCSHKMTSSHEMNGLQETIFLIETNRSHKTKLIYEQCAQQKRKLNKHDRSQADNGSKA